ncbi:hypothetical protein Q73_15390 [Bacillus coahuilensis m2-6]|uniref:hypothetical protein n=1 Tax=Bacillus coahuilensis TaxID=408580 RepID=UPI000185070C|nr:hypothetical protein [Bacillus coahuilensis]KUP04511.1 hypothetical protein Q73_15390 [Bacillus coahuilensis m2-6]
MSDVKDFVFIKSNPRDKSVHLAGIEFHEFMKAQTTPLQHLLLLKHQVQATSFNMHTLFEYVPKEEIPQLLKENGKPSGDFCWLDFADDSGLNELTEQEIAELLYLGHTMKHLTPPFYRKLQNEFVYLTEEDGYANKLYIQQFEKIYEWLGVILSRKIRHAKKERRLLGKAKDIDVLSIPPYAFQPLLKAMDDGLAFSVLQTKVSRQKIEMPFWRISDYTTFDFMYDEYEMRSKEKPHGYLVYDRKQQSWSAVVLTK